MNENITKIIEIYEPHDRTLAGIHIQGIIANNILKIDNSAPDFFHRRHGKQQHSLVH